MTSADTLQAERITQRYGATAALDAVSFDVRPGEIHALVGENGAGKSTLIKVLTGAVSPTGGTLRLGEEAVTLTSPHDARRRGIGVVHQDYNLFPALSVATNICGVARPPAGLRARASRPRSLQRAARTVMDELGLDLDPARPVAGLGAAERRLVEIARALVQRPRFLLLDEPTAALEPTETDRLLGVITALRDAGTGIILVSHRLGEICAIADRATALRDGRVVGTLGRGELNPARLTRLMVGGDVVDIDGPPHEPGPPCFAIRNLRLRPGARPVEIDVGRREVVAVIGLVGSGCGQVLETAVGARRDRAAEVVLDGRPLRLRGPADAVRCGIGYAPEDRKRLGLVMEHSIRANMGLASLPRWSRAGFTRRRGLRDAAEASRERFDVRCRSTDQPVGRLSGGNQQKVLLARCALADVGVLVLHEPTQGVDVHARRTIHQHLLDFAAGGGSVLVSSTDIDEVRAIAHRIYVLHAGELTRVWDNTVTPRPSRADITESVTADPRLTRTVEVSS